jgi:uncharacterized protein YjiS (DUF1127 family)
MIMTTAHIHSITLGGIIGAAKSALAKPAMAVIRMQRMIKVFSFSGWLQGVYRNHRSRRQLATLDSRMLADIGVSEAQRRVELRKPFWRNQRPG